MRQLNINNEKKGQKTMTIKRVILYESTQHWSVGPC